MIYLTYADQPSGVFSSQVSDVCNFLNKHAGASITLVAFISVHDFGKNRKRIKKEISRAIVVPMLPRMSSFGFNALMLWAILVFTGQRSIIARNVLACNLALRLKKYLKLKVCFDGRGAIAAEWNEYDVVPLASWKERIHQWERHAVNQSDWRIAVSSRLVTYWAERYHYTGSRHSVIPCTLNSEFKSSLLTQQLITDARTRFNFTDQDIVLVYSGSTAGWQSFSLLHSFLKNVIESDNRIKVLFLSANDDNIVRLQNEFPGRIQQQFVNHHEVTGVLMACDFGILIREKSVTNKVASPTKFAEYLSAGLPVLISNEIGDYSEFVLHHACGYVISDESSMALTRPDAQERNRLIGLVETHFTKAAHLENYRHLVQALT
jgi:glycosyltransferase involved in cell wall biosynthesis